MLYRAAGNDPEHIIRFGLATSTDGYNFTRSSDEPVFEPSVDGFDAGCVEDPRIVKMGDYYYITYAAKHFPPGQYWKPDDERMYWPECPEEFPWIIRRNNTVTGLAITKDFKTWIRAGRITDPSVDDRDVILFPEKVGGRYVMLHRPMGWVGRHYGTEHPAIWMSFSDDLLSWQDSRLLAKAENSDWEVKIGGNEPPIKTEKGWLIFYHGVSVDRFYRLGAMLLDLDEPWRVTHRTPNWLLEPQHDFEKRGCFRGGGVLFPCSKVVIEGTLFLYYGAADKYIGLATCPLWEVVDHVAQFRVD